MNCTCRFLNGNTTGQVNVITFATWDNMLSMCFPCKTYHVAAFYFPRKIQGHGWDVNYDNELLERGRENLHE